MTPVAPRIKVSPTGVIVVWEPNRTPQRPWFTVHTPNLPDHAARQMLFTEVEVESWSEWRPVPVESVIPAKEVLKGHEVLDRGVWQVVARVTHDRDDLGSDRTWLLFEEKPSAYLFDANELLTVRSSR